MDVERGRKLRPYPLEALVRRRTELAARGVEVLDFGTGDPVEPTSPHIRAALRDAVPEVSQYPTVKGERPLREAIARWYRQRFDVELDPDTEILPTQGSKEAVFHLPLVLVDATERKRGVIFPVPGYPVMEIGSLYAGATLVPYLLNEENGYRMDPGQVAAVDLAQARIAWLNYPHNPTGQDLPDELFEAWVEARDRYGFVLCSDECYTEIWFGRRPRSVLEFGRQGCLAFHSLSKRSGMTGYRSGFVAGDADLVALYAQSRASFGLAMPVPTQAASAAAWSDEAHVAERREIFRRKREIVTEGLEQRGLRVFPATSTFYLWVQVPHGETGASYAEALLEHGIVVSPGAFFGPGNDAWVRLALVPSVARCREAIARWPDPRAGTRAIGAADR